MCSDYTRKVKAFMDTLEDDDVVSWSCNGVRMRGECACEDVVVCANVGASVREYESETEPAIVRDLRLRNQVHKGSTTGDGAIAKLNWGKNLQAHKVP